MSKTISIRGKIVDGDIQKITLKKNNGLTGYRLTSMTLMPEKCGTTDFEHTIKIYKVPQTTATEEIDFNDYNYVTMRKGGGGDIKNILYRLTYHDIYIFYEHIKDLVITEIKHSENEHGDDLQFIVKFEDEKEIEFYYDLKQIEKEHWINDK